MIKWQNLLQNIGIERQNVEMEYLTSPKIHATERIQNQQNKKLPHIHLKLEAAIVQLPQISNQHMIKQKEGGR